MPDSTPDPRSRCRHCGAALAPDTLVSACWSCVARVAAGSGVPFRNGTSPTDSGTGEALAPGHEEAFRLGDYYLEEQIAHGGMGVVYRAYQTSLARVVAIKLLLLGRYSSADSIRRFHREARSAAALRHPNIVSIYEVGESEGQPFLAMEFVEGRSLAEVSRQGPLPPLRAARHVRVVAEAVAYAHSQGVLHRDIKPSNVLLDVFDQIRLTDFGLAKKLDGSGDLTLTGEVLGSPNYLSPEQAEGRQAEVGPRSDVYGAGALLYELLTGRPPFLAPSVPETLVRIRDSDPIAPSRLSPGIPEDLDTIVLKCLEKSPDRRYASAAALADDLHRFLRHEPITARPVSTFERSAKWVRRHRARAALLATLALLLVVVTAGSLWFSFRVRMAQLETEAANQRLARNLFVREWNDAEQLFEEGKTVPALTWFSQAVRADPSNSVAAARLLAVLGDLTISVPASEPLRHPGAVLSTSFSPDGQRLVTASADGRVRVWAWSQPAEPRVLPRIFQKPAVVWIPRTDRLLVAEPSGISLWTPDGTLDRERSNPVRGSLRWEVSRDGRFGVLESTEDSPQLWDLLAFERVESPAFTDRTLRRVGYGGSGRFLLRSWISHQQSDWNLGLEDIVTGQRIWQVKPPENPRASHIHTALISDDDSLVAVCRWGGQTLVYRVPSTGGVDAPASPKVEPVFQWDFGEVNRAECFRFLGGNRRLLVAMTDGQVQQVDLETGQILPDRIDHAGQVNATAVTPDGRTLATASVDGMVQFWDLRPRRSEPVFLQRSNVVWDVAFAPDSSNLVIAGDPEAAIYDATTGTLRHRLPMGKLVSRVVYSPDGRRVAVSTERGSLRIWDAATGQPVTPMLAASDRIHDLSYSGDGRWLVLGGPADRVRLLEGETGRPALPEFTTSAAIVATLVTPGGHRLVAGTVHGQVHFWSLPDGAEVPAQGRHRSVVWATRASRDGRLVATASGDRTAIVWDAVTGAVRREFRSEKAVYAAVFSPDGRRLVLGSADRTARIREVESGRASSEIMRHPGGVWFVEFSPDGSLVATGDDLGYARLWDAGSGLPVGNWLRSRGSLKRVVFAPDGRRIATASADGLGRVWPVVVVPAPAPDWLPDLAEAVAGRRLDPDDNLQGVPFESWLTIRERVRAAGESGQGFYDRWARWFLVERLADGSPVPSHDR